MKISEAKGILKVGDRVRVEYDNHGIYKLIIGEIGEIEERRFYVWQNESNGSRGKIQPETKGYKYSWSVNWEINSDNEITILNEERGMTPDEFKGLKIGDIIQSNVEGTYEKGTTFRVVGTFEDKIITEELRGRGEMSYTLYYAHNLTLIKSTNNNTMTNLITKFKSIIKSEPNKTLEKAGVIDSNDNLTSDGKELFINYLFEKSKADFTKEVVEKLVEDNNK